MDVLVSAIWLCPALVPRDYVLLDMKLFAWATTDIDSARNELLSSMLSLLKAPEVHQQTGNPTPEHILVTETMEDALFAVKAVYTGQSVLWGKLWREIIPQNQIETYQNDLCTPCPHTPSYHPTLWHGDFLLVRDVEYTSENFYSYFESYLRGEIR